MTLLVLLPLDELKSAFARIPIRTWLLALPLFLAFHMLGALKWFLAVNAAGGGIAVRTAARCYYYGLFGTLFLPSVAGGDVIRVGLAAKHARSPSGVVVGSVVDRILDIGALLSITTFGLVLLPGALDSQGSALLRGGESR